MTHIPVFTIHSLSGPVRERKQKCSQHGIRVLIKLIKDSGAQKKVIWSSCSERDGGSDVKGMMGPMATKQ
jgi:hypothetical protein